MKLGIGSYTYAWAIGIPGYPLPDHPMAADDLVQRAADLGVGVVQIADNLPLHVLSDAQLTALRSLAQRHNIQIEVGTRGIDPDHIRRYLSLALRFDSPILRIVADTTIHHPSPPEVVATLRALIPDLEKAGIALAIENHDRFKARTLIEIIEQIDSPAVGICLDTVNSFGAGEGPEVVVATLGPHVVNLHVKDYTIRRHPTMLGFEVQGTLAGQGMLNIPWLLEQLGNLSKRDYNAILELWTPPAETTEDSIKKEAEWALDSIHYLNTLI